MTLVCQSLKEIEKLATKLRKATVRARGMGQVRRSGGAVHAGPGHGSRGACPARCICCPHLPAGRQEQARRAGAAGAVRSGAWLDAMWACSVLASFAPQW